MNRVEYSILGVDKEENAILMYIARPSKLLTMGVVIWERQDKESIFINLHELDTNKNTIF